MRRHYLYLDLGFYSACNLKCVYCRDEIVRDRKDFTLANLMGQVDAFRRNFTAAVIKLSGYGEVTMWRDFEKSLELLSPLFPQVQVISNGTFQERIADAFLAHPNVTPNITLDGHTPAANALRVEGNARQHRAILGNIERFADAGRPVEVNCVLHGANVDALADFCQYLTDVAGDHVMLFPFPVKSFDRTPGTGLRLRAGFTELADQIDDIWERFAGILPPRAYLDDLKSFLVRGSRVDACHVHWANTGTGSRNERLHCPNYGEDLTYGPMVEALTTGAQDVMRQENEHLQKGHVGPACSTCFNHFDVINLYLDGRIDLAELQSLPSLRAPGTGEIAEAIKREFRQLRQLPIVSR